MNKKPDNKNLVQELRDKWLILLLDIVAVNLSYYLALMIRFYMNHEFLSTVSYYTGYFERFAPFYTVLAVIVFIVFRLYSGVWRYAGLNDMNRVLMANLVTLVVQVGVSMISIALFRDEARKVIRMPYSYYAIGFVLQFAFMIGVRFLPRLFAEERTRIGNHAITAIPTLVIGAGETCHRILRNLDEKSPFKVEVILDDHRAGRTFDGVPVIGGSLEEALDKNEVRTVFLANPRVPEEERTRIQDICKQRDLKIYDYTGNLENVGGGVPLTALLDVARGPVTLQVGDDLRTFPSAAEALREITGAYEVIEVTDLKAVLGKHSDAAYVGFENWAQQYKEETGRDLSFF